jgi:hypothetical protein
MSDFIEQLKEHIAPDNNNKKKKKEEEKKQS